MENRFIVLVDLTKNSENLLQLAWNLSSRDDSEIVILHQSIAPLPVLAETEMKEKIKRQQAQKILEELKKYTGGFFESKKNLVYLVSREHLAEQIQSLSDPNFNDIVVTGIKPKNLPERMLLGSTAARLANHADSTIIAVPEGITELNMQHLCVALSPKYPLNNIAFERFLRTTKDIQKITFMNVFSKDEEIEPGNEILRKAEQKYADRFNVSIAFIKGNDPKIEVENHLKRESGLLVLQRGTRKLSDVLRNFFVNRFVYNAELPLVILP